MSLRGRPPVSPQPCAHLRPGSEPPSPPSGRLCVLCIVRHVLCASFIGLAPVPAGTVRFTVSSGPTPYGGRWADQLGSWDRRGRAGRHPRGPVKGARRGRTPRMSPDGGVVAWSELVSGGTWGRVTKEGEPDGHQSWPRGPSQFVARGAAELRARTSRVGSFSVCSQKGVRTPVCVLRRHGSRLLSPFPHREATRHSETAVVHGHQAGGCARVERSPRPQQLRLPAACEWPCPA